MDSGRPYAFVLLPQRPEFAEFYEDVIRPSLEDVGYEVEQAVQAFDDREQLRGAIMSIYRARLVVADITVMNSQLYYELGLAQGLLKPMIVMTRQIERLPPAFQGARILEYTLHYKRVNELRARLRELARQCLTGTIEHSNPVLEIVGQLGAPPAYAELPAPAPAAAADSPPASAAAAEPPPAPAAVADPPTSVRRERPAAKPAAASPPPAAAEAPSPAASRSDRSKIIELALGARAGMDKISGCCKRINGATNAFEQSQSTLVDIVAAARGKNLSSNAQYNAAVDSALRDGETYSLTLANETSILSYSWLQLLDGATDLINATWQENTVEARESAQVVSDQLHTLQELIEKTLTALQNTDDSVAVMPRDVGSNLDRVLGHVADALNSLRSELSVGQSYITRALSLAIDRLYSAKPSPSANEG